MRTVKEVSKLTGVSVRTLHHYDAIGLLTPTAVTEASYRLYDDAALERLQQILLFRELEFPLKEIKAILESPDFDRARALEQQITLLTLKKARLERLIALAREIKTMGECTMNFTAFDTGEMDAYAAEAKAMYGKTPEYREFEEKSRGRTREKTDELGAQMMSIFAEFGEIAQEPPAGEQAQRQVKKLQDFITAHYYTCSEEVLQGLGRLYVEDGAFRENIDKVGGDGTADFVHQAIEIYCGK